MKGGRGGVELWEWGTRDGEGWERSETTGFQVVKRI